jgi:hypothetical protein
MQKPIIQFDSLEEWRSPEHRSSCAADRNTIDFAEKSLEPLVFPELNFPLGREGCRWTEDPSLVPSAFGTVTRQQIVEMGDRLTVA